MRALVLSDIHGNLHALTAVLAAAAGPLGGGYDALWNLGDVVGYGARPNEVLEAVRAQATVNVRGNHDRVCAGITSSHGFNPVAAEAAAWTHDHLSMDNLEWLRALPTGPVQASARALCAHGSPLHEDHYIISMRDAFAPLQRMAAELTFFGHTHVQGAFSQRSEEWEEVWPAYAGEEGESCFRMEVPAGTRHLINPGSVGQPRDGDWRAAFAIFEFDGGALGESSDAGEQQAQAVGRRAQAAESVTFFRVPYDVEAAQAAIRQAHLPERLAARLASGR